MDLTAIKDLIRHMEWADAAVWSSVLMSGNGRTDTKICNYLNHLHAAQRAFLRTWRQEPRETPYPTFDDAVSLMRWGQTYYGEAFAYLQTLDEAKLSAPMNLAWSPMVEKRLGRAPEPTTIADTALQVVFHSMYHRGQINARLREVGGDPPLVDYIAWVWLGRPLAVWPPAMSETAAERSPGLSG